MSRKSGDSTPELETRETPQRLADAIIKRVEGFDVWDTPRILEPSSGSGVFVRAARAQWPNALIHSVDLRPNLEQLNIAAGSNAHFEDNTVEYAADKEFEIREVVRAMHQHATPQYDLIVGNPPFTKAEEHIRALIPLLSPQGVLAFLLRINFFGGKDRAGKFWRELPERSFYPIAPRPSFGKSLKTGKKGTDGTEYALFCWTPGVTCAGMRGAHLLWIPEKAKRAKKLK